MQPPRTLLNRLFPPTPPSTTTTWQRADPVPSARLPHPRVRTYARMHASPLPVLSDRKQSHLQLTLPTPALFQNRPTRLQQSTLRRRVKPAAAVLLDQRLEVGSGVWADEVSVDVYAERTGLWE